MSSWDIYGKKIKTKLKRIPADEGYRALFDPEKWEIIVDKSLKPYESLQSELHECLHAVMFRLSMTEAQLKHEIEEVIVNGVSTWLMENRKTLLKRLKELDEPKLSLQPVTAKSSTETK